MVECVDDIASDLSVFHGIKDGNKLSSATFFMLAYRLPIYAGAVRAWLVSQAQAIPEPERPQGITDERYLPSKTRMSNLPPPSLEELHSRWGAKPEIGQNVPMFEVARAT